MAVKLGNLLPNQVAILKYQIVSQIEIVGGFYAFKLPTAFYPDYKKQGIQDQDTYAYSFDYEARILSENSHISNLILPKHASITSQNDNKTYITVRSEQVHRTVDLYYRTSDMMIPQLQYALSPDGNEAAVSVSLVPTFDAIAPQDAFEVLEDEKPAQLPETGANFHFFFVVDRSYSMSSMNRMHLAREALDIFVRSLPQGCTFTIISFGDRHAAMCCQAVEGGEYTDCMINNEKCKEYALRQIREMEADFGGTNILYPLTACQGQYRTGLKKRVFLLTDGAVCDPNRVIEQARSMRDDVRVFSFGLGSGCDENLVTQVAKAGRGTSTIVRDGSADLNGQVIKALSISMEPSFCDTKYGFNDQL